MQQGLKLGMLTYLHFFVDFACAFWVNYMIICCYDDGILYYESNGIAYILWLVLLYNFCAFVLQLPLGMLLDRLYQKRSWQTAALGCIIIGITGVMFYQFQSDVSYTMPGMIAMPLFLGIGNALFHVGAGVRVLQMGERMAPVGIFVSGGAFGIFLGGLFWRYLTRSYSYNYYVIDSYENIIVLLFAIIAVLSFAAAVVLLLGAEMDQGKIDLPEKSRKNSRNAVIMFLLFLVVVLRSFQGSFVQFSWNTDIPIALIFVLCIVAGKALGGILADRFGVPLALIPLFLSALLFLPSENMLFGLGAILLFQTTMPITLSLMHKQLPKLPGTAFGLLSFALFVGYLPKFLFDYYKITALWYRNSFWKWSVVDISSRVGRWWMQYHETYVYSIVTGISLLLLVFLLCLWHRKER